MNLNERHHWIFDLDGTLTVAVHDFDAIRCELGLAPEKPILEQLAGMPDDDAHSLRQRLDEIEAALARRAVAQEGAEDLLTELSRRGARVGILTRNSRENALVTLEACGLRRFFDERTILGRDCCDPKPSADGIRRMLAIWQASPSDAVMVGDYLFDIVAGRDAGTATVYFDPAGAFEHADWAEVTVTSLGAIVEALR